MADAVCRFPHFSRQLLFLIEEKKGGERKKNVSSFSFQVFLSFRSPSGLQKMDLDWLLVEKPGAGEAVTQGERSPNGVLRPAADGARRDDDLSDADSSTASSFNAASSTSGRNSTGAAERQGLRSRSAGSGRRSPRLRAAAAQAALGMQTPAPPTTMPTPLSRPGHPPRQQQQQQRETNDGRSPASPSPSSSLRSAAKRLLASFVASLRESVSPEELALFKTALAVVVALVAAVAVVSFSSRGAAGGGGSGGAAMTNPTRLSLCSSPEEQQRQHLRSTAAALPSLPPI